MNIFNFFLFLSLPLCVCEFRNVLLIIFPQIPIFMSFRVFTVSMNSSVRVQTD